MRETLHPELLAFLDDARWIPTAHGVAARALELAEPERAHGGAVDERDLAWLLGVDIVFVANLLALTSRPDADEGAPDLVGALYRADRRVLRLAASSFRLAGLDEATSAARFARENALAAGLARELADGFGCSPELGALAALFAGVGEQVLASCMPEQYAAILELDVRRSERLSLERERVGTDHAELSAAWLAANGVVGVLVDAVARQHDHERGLSGDDEGAQLAELAGLARELAQLLGRAQEQGSEPSLPARLFVQLEERCQIEASSWQALAAAVQAPIAALEDIWSLRLDGEQRGLLIERAHGVAAHAAVGWARAQRGQQHQQLAQASRDPVSGMANRAYFEDRLSLLLKAYKRDQADVAVWLVELDDFVALSAKCGSDASAQLLRRVGRALLSAVREVDLVARFDDTTFAVLGPRTDWRGACILANRLRPIVARLPVAGGPGGGSGEGVTASIGVMTVSGLEGLPTVSKVLAAAQEQLGCARASGGNTWAYRDVSPATFKAA